MKRSILAFVVLAGTLAATPFVSNNYIVQQATFICFYAALAMSWNFIGGYAGYPSFSTAAFLGLGAYAGAILQNAGVPMVTAWLLATVVVGVFAALLGFAILRMKGHYFAIGSISIVEVLRLIASSWSSFTGGGEGLNVKILQGGPEYAGKVFFFSMFAVMVAAFIATCLVERSRLGFALRCIEQNEDAADMVGVRTTACKIEAFILSAIFCGTAGAISASWTAYIAPVDAFSILITLKVPVMALLGGAGTVIGPMIGAFSFTIVEQVVWSRFLEYNQAILGVVIVLLIFFLPGGLLKIQWRRSSNSKA